MAITSEPLIITDPSVLLGSLELDVTANTVTVHAVYAEADATSYVKPNAKRKTLIGCNVTIPVLLSFHATTGSFQALLALAGTIVTVVIKPTNTSASATNPSATFSAQIPTILPFAEMKIGETMRYNLELTSDAAPVIAYT